MIQPVTVEHSGIRQLIREAIINNERIHCLFGKRLKGLRFRIFLKQCSRLLKHKKGIVVREDIQGLGLALIVPISRDTDQRKATRWWSFLWWFSSLKRIGMMKRFRKRTQQLLPREPHLFFMLLLNEEQRNGQSQIIELRDELFTMSEVMQLPVYAQTSSNHTRELFERFGFTTYGKVPIPYQNEFVYFLVRGTGTTIKTS